MMVVQIFCQQLLGRATMSAELGKRSNTILLRGVMECLHRINEQMMRCDAITTHLGGTNIMANHGNPHGPRSLRWQQ